MYFAEINSKYSHCMLIKFFLIKFFFSMLCFILTFALLLLIIIYAVLSIKYNIFFKSKDEKVKIKQNTMCKCTLPSTVKLY